MSRVSDPAVIASWEQRLHEFSQSNLPVAGFCRQAGVSVATFYYWKRKLAPRSAASPSKPAPRSAGPRFAAVEITAGPSIEVHLPGVSAHHSHSRAVSGAWRLSESYCPCDGSKTLAFRRNL